MEYIVGALIVLIFYCFYNIGFYKAKLESLCDYNEIRDILISVHKNELENVTNKYKKIIQQLVTANSEEVPEDDDKKYFVSRKPEDLN